MWYFSENAENVARIESQSPLIQQRQTQELWAKTYIISHIDNLKISKGKNSSYLGILVQFFFTKQEKWCARWHQLPMRHAWWKPALTTNGYHSMMKFTMEERVFLILAYNKCFCASHFRTQFTLKFNHDNWRKLPRVSRYWIKGDWDSILAVFSALSDKYHILMIVR